MRLNLKTYRFVSQIVFLGVWAFGAYYQLHTFIIILLAATLLAGNFFCGWVCPFGSAQDMMSRLGSLFLKKKFQTPPAVQKYLKYSRYFLFILIILKIAPMLIYEANGYMSFLFSLSDILAGTFTFTVANILLLSYLIIAVFFNRPFCNYLCSEGVKFGLANITRIFSVKRETTSCIDCKMCDQKCPMNIQISTQKHVRDIQCINCMECIAACPMKGTLSYKYTGWKRN